MQYAVSMVHDAHVLQDPAGILIDIDRELDWHFVAAASNLAVPKNLQAYTELTR
jgi:hypothetical protein